jgi:hypothetical protein
MNPNTNELLLLSSFFYLLGIGCLMVIGLRTAVLYKVGVHAVGVGGVIWWFGNIRQ